jgi:hypothetical protein
VVTSAVATPVATFSRAEQTPPTRSLVSLGLLPSGWRDLNSRPLDPQIGGLVVSCTPERAIKDWGGGVRAPCDCALNSLGPIWAQVTRLIVKVSRPSH